MLATSSQRRFEGGEIEVSNNFEGVLKQAENFAQSLALFVEVADRFGLPLITLDSLGKRKASLVDRTLRLVV
ncbi:uncharacterized protein ColSpa_12796 [Colletotrichum spaethianum]|uniref:Uncharacterized protein n=1 Tax=Colletotrichum spaethianum TaxID=700344 RepID=A0AA37PI87_9PEZI|nr:uncharacterized protein ColSpa_12796 [Colletotrichum spaethianum]GKT52615.1 hypothetical protein ColSpa_12796 [Colletotrichum spaethianum]